MSDRKKDLFYKEVEGRMESLKRRPAEKKKTTFRKRSRHFNDHWFDSAELFLTSSECVRGS